MTRTQHSKNSRIKKLFTLPLIVSLLGTMLAFGGAATTAFAEEAAPKPASFPIPALSDTFKQSSLSNVIVIGTGGTLAGKAEDSTSFQNYKAGTYLIEDLVKQLPGKQKIADVTTYQFGNKGSGGYTIADLYDLSLAVDQALEVYDSAVVTTGTDTMEEIAYFLDLTVRSPKPVVVTGAMRPWDVIGTDAPANLYNAIKLAGSGKTNWYGTVIMLNDVIQAAREVTKSNAQRLDTFATPILGALGYIDESNIRMYRLNGRAMKAGKADWATPFDLKSITKDKLPTVEIVYSYQEASSGAIRGFVADGAKGIVTAGTGAGGISAQMSAARSEAIKQGVVFVTTTRTGSGTMYPGTTDGIFAGDSLNAQHARLMLLLSLAFSSDYNTIKGWFATYGTQSIGVDPSDIAKHWAEVTIGKAIKDGIVSGYPDTSFKPNKNVTRAEFAVMLMNGLKPVSEGAKLAFTDEKEIGTWAKNAVAQAVKAGFIQGYEDGTFRPNEPITRTEMASMIAGAMNLKADPSAATGFTDDQEIPLWGKGAVIALKQAGVISGNENNQYAPSGSTTRAEAVTVIINMLNKK
ncbi:L-asparaginase type II [Paenibacillus sp. V4I9]|uniref:asparaginase domain-containing protein n=1 Tax=Paenibacillus sp. V4I9 TaxID=3042308 RepID=UPI00278A8841|nr:asparaginase domain-containing protein [Paenibacillus sp. V4I9]MDQ0885564.1 L-asparaginase type II [Paenibacillus sp. V4I9]